MLLLRKNTATHPLQLRKRAGGYKAIAKEEEDEDEEEEDEDEEDTGDEDEDADEDEDSDQGDEETSCGAAGEKKGVGDGKSAADVLIVGEEKAQHHKEDGKRASEGVNDAPAATKAKTTTLSTEQHIYMYPLRPRARGVCLCVQCDIYLSILDGLSIYLPIYVSRIYLSICSWPSSCQRCLRWSLPCVCVCVCVCVCL